MLEGPYAKKAIGGDGAEARHELQTEVGPMITEQQITHFRTFGFLILRDVFSAAEVETMVLEFERGREATLRSEPSAGSDHLTQWSNLKPESPFIAGLLEDPRFCEVAEQLLDEGAVAVFANSNRRGGDTRWHPDTSDQHLRGFKFTTYLQPLTANTGALRVVPGSHKRPLHDEVDRFLSEAKLEVGDAPANVCETRPGDVIAFDMRLFHAAQGGSMDRRQLTFAYLRLPRTLEEEATLKVCQAILQVHKSTGAPPPHHPPDWLANPEGSPRRRHWISKLMEWGIVDPQ